MTPSRPKTSSHSSANRSDGRNLDVSTMATALVEKPILRPNCFWVSSAANRWRRSSYANRARGDSSGSMSIILVMRSPRDTWPDLTH